VSPPIRLAVSAIALLLVGCGDKTQPTQYGADPTLPKPQRGLLPNMTIANPAGWGDRRPEVPEGYIITRIASDLKVPRQTLVLPNGDILIAEGKGGREAPVLRPKDLIAGYFKSKGTTSESGGDRLTLLRDTDGDGRYEVRRVFAENLNAPYGLALIGDRLYVANQDALMRFDYQPGQTRADGPPILVAQLPAGINHHWTKALTASADGRVL
jgi:glucose/arabinose dehydrogenase